jgi:hypothetical protein
MDSLWFSTISLVPVSCPIPPPARLPSNPEEVEIAIEKITFLFYFLRFIAP